MGADDSGSDGEDEATSDAEVFRMRAEAADRERSRMVEEDVFGLKGYRVNAPPVEPFEDDDEEEGQSILAKVFAAGGWRIDNDKKRRSLNHDAIMRSLELEGRSSLYATAKCKYSGVTALHACALNGYYDLAVALLEKGRVDVLEVAEGLSSFFDRKREKAVADAYHIAKRRGHTAIVDYLGTLPDVQESLKDDQLTSDQRDEKRRIAQEKIDRLNGAMIGMARRAQKRRGREDLRAADLRVGDRVIVCFSKKQRPAVVRFKGLVGYRDGTIVGVELDEPTGKNDGTVKGRAYFVCRKKHGLMLAPSDILRVTATEDRRPVPVLHAVDDLQLNKQASLDYFYQKDVLVLAAKKAAALLPVKKASSSKRLLPHKTRDATKAATNT